MGGMCAHYPIGGIGYSRYVSYISTKYSDFPQYENIFRFAAI
jgi:hypothetical protein